MEAACQALKDLWRAVYAIEQQGRIEGIALGLILAGRGALIDGHSELEQAAAVIMAEHLSRQGGSSET